MTYLNNFFIFILLFIHYLFIFIFIFKYFHLIIISIGKKKIARLHPLKINNLNYQ